MKTIYVYSGYNTVECDCRGYSRNLSISYLGESCTSIWSILIQVYLASWPPHKVCSHPTAQSPHLNFAQDQQSANPPRRGISRTPGAICRRVRKLRRACRGSWRFRLCRCSPCPRCCCCTRRRRRCRRGRRWGGRCWCRGEPVGGRKNNLNGIKFFENKLVCKN